MFNEVARLREQSGPDDGRGRGRGLRFLVCLWLMSAELIVKMIMDCKDVEVMMVRFMTIGLGSDGCGAGDGGNETHGAGYLLGGENDGDFAVVLG